jgi:hypothetical protein
MSGRSAAAIGALDQRTIATPVDVGCDSLPAESRAVIVSL